MNITLRYGDRGQTVRCLQQLLNRHGATLVLDGHYSDVTKHAVKVFQLHVGLVADSIAGPKTHTALTGGNCQRFLKHVDLSHAAQRLGVPLASIYALNEVLSRGMGFLDNGKPLILFERHLMYCQLTIPQLPDDDAASLQQHADHLVALHPALVNPQPGAYAGGTAEHQRLCMARLLDESAALQATAWGAFQILGFHWQRLGYASVQAFANAMTDCEAQQFEAFVRFIQTDPALHKALKARKWAEFTKSYIGPDFHRQLTDIKLQRAYERYAACHLAKGEPHD
ncbi:N-acetylmuramidase domain-containing protein [Pseudomonas sp. NPDC098747]|uniref:N-acetylmuramidase domain-containing protein n=1 Tax=Pseudomonas sp. NPDC098747 TaxID=3364487 RepID=UPI00383A17D6